MGGRRVPSGMSIADSPGMTSLERIRTRAHIIIVLMALTGAVSTVAVGCGVEDDTSSADQHMIASSTRVRHDGR